MEELGTLVGFILWPVSAPASRLGPCLPEGADGFPVEMARELGGDGDGDEDDRDSMYKEVRTDRVSSDSSRDRLKLDER